MLFPGYWALFSKIYLQSNSRLWLLWKPSTSSTLPPFFGYRNKYFENYPSLRKWSEKIPAYHYRGCKYLNSSQLGAAGWYIWICVAGACWYCSSIICGCMVDCCCCCCDWLPVWASCCTSWCWTSDWLAVPGMSTFEELSSSWSGGSVSYLPRLKRPYSEEYGRL